MSPLSLLLIGQFLRAPHARTGESDHKPLDAFGTSRTPRAHR
ncbi:hypothetical protein OEM_p200050 (plasmid) [Mycobacterium intracellulare subsp. yongonense 05-1390]|nr:hypothetical protein OEM_p200050 [Mycobacterium intracellulare subsp. yongonense 05-1390]